MNIQKLIDSSFVSSRVFYPRKAPEPNLKNIDAEILKFTVQDEIQLGGLFFKHSRCENVPTIMFFHGNGEIIHDYLYESFYENYLQCDVNFAIFDYRGYGFSNGRPTYSSLLNDPIILYQKFNDFLAEKYGDAKCANSLFVMGRSLGSVCASSLGAKNYEKVKGIIFESGYASLFRIITHLFMIDLPDFNIQSLKEFSNDTYIRKIRKPCLVIHGTRDNIIPFDEGKNLFATIDKENDKKFVEIKNASHNDIQMYKKEYFSNLKNFIANNS